jgi:hypothetical protein
MVARGGAEPATRGFSVQIRELHFQPVECGYVAASCQFRMAQSGHSKPARSAAQLNPATIRAAMACANRLERAALEPAGHRPVLVDRAWCPGRHSNRRLRHCHWNARLRTIGAAGDCTRHRLRGLADVPGLAILGLAQHEAAGTNRESLHVHSEYEKTQTNRTLSAIGPIGILLLSVAYVPALAAMPRNQHPSRSRYSTSSWKM